jgi:cyclic pyranopterin phosphate synthase
MNKLTHFDDQGAARMVDISAKPETVREAVAAGTVSMLPATLKLILDRQITKGDVFAVARIAGIMAAKRTAELIPLCHPLALTSVEVVFEPDQAAHRVHITAIARTTGRTGVEMEALTAVTTAGLTVYDMCKAADREMVIGDIRLLRKSGGKSGTFERGKKTDVS